MKKIGFVALFLAVSTAPGVSAGFEELNVGIAARNRGDWDTAIVHLGNALAANDLIPDLQYVAHLDRGDAYAAKGNLDAAIADFTACIGQRPDDQTPRFHRAAVAITAGKPEAAREDTDAAIAADPADSEAYLLRARIYEIAGDGKNQLKDLQTAQANDPKNLQILFDIGIADFLAGQADDAAKTFTKFLESPGRCEYAWLWQAMATLKQGKDVSPEVSSRFDRKAWPGPVMNFFQGHATEEAVNAAAAQGDARALPGQVCEANFYLGEWRLLHNDGDGARPLLQKAAHDCPAGFIELYAAQGVLKNAP